MPTGANNLTGHDIRGGIEDANDIMKGVQGDIRTLAKETRWLGLTGSDREDFFKGMTQDEYDTLHAVATALGPKGENKLEMILREVMSLRAN